MSRQRQAFGNSSRATPFSGSGNVGASSVQILGTTLDDVAEEVPRIVGNFRAITDGVVLDGNNLHAFMATAALNYGVRIGASTTVDRIKAGADNADAVAVQTLGALLALARLSGFNGTTWDRLRSAGDASDAVATAALGELISLSRNTVFNNATWDRLRSGSAANLATLLSNGSVLVNRPGNWSINHTPATGTQATIARAAGGAGVRHVCTSISYALIIPPTVNQPLIQVNLRDGATGAGTILWSETVGVGAALANGGDVRSTLGGLEIVGTANTAMTLEFSAAGAATTSESVALTGHDAS